MIKINFKEILDLTKNRIDELDQDVQVDEIIKSAINKALAEISEVDKRFNTAFVPVINGLATLPDDLNKVEKITPELIDGEIVKGNAIFSDRTITFNIIYSVTPEELVEDNDEPSILPKYHYILSSFACYSYYAYKKKPDMAQIYLNEYQSTLAKAKNSIIAASPRKFINSYREE